MANIELTDDVVTVRLSPLERLAALRGNIEVPWRSVRDVQVVDRPTPRGLRAPGTWIPGVLAYGTYRRADGPEFYAVRRGQRAVRILLDGAPFAALTVGVPDPEEVSAAIRSGGRSSRV